MKTSKLIILAIVIISFASCKKKIETLQYTGTITGYVYVYDKSDWYVTTNADGINVTIGDTISAVTDNAGKFVLENVPFGTYDIRYEKRGITSFTKYGYQFVGGNETPAYLGTIYMMEMPTHYVTNFAIDEMSLNLQWYAFTTISGNIVNNVEGSKIRVYYHDTDEVSQTKYTGYFELYGEDDAFSLTENIGIADLDNSNIYMVAYGYYSGGYTWQYDPETGKNKNPTYTQVSNIASFTIPTE